MTRAALRCAVALVLLSFGATTRAAPVTGTRGMVASAHPLASEAGAEMLRAGGNAVDAAVATAFALAVVEPYSSGVGGGGFATLKVGEAVEFWDFREVAPRAATREMFIKDGKANASLSQDGILGAAVPGAVAGYLGLHERFGKLPRAKVLAPAIRLARVGFGAGPTFRANATERLELLRQDPEAARIFLVQAAAGEPRAVPAPGQLVVQRELAVTLGTIARGGAKAFYEGAIAKKLAADMRARGGLITLEDLAAYKVKRHEPLLGTFRGHAVVTAPPPSAGGEVVLTILNAMETLPAERAWRDVDALHLYIEASKRAFADRQLIGDPAFVPDLTRALVDKTRVGAMLKLIGTRATAAKDVPPGQAASLPKRTVDAGPAATPQKPHTTHLCVVDKDGNAVSLTSTLNYSFGSGVVAKGTGVVWNDHMDDFAIAPGIANIYGIVGAEANTIAPGKTPLSSMSPTLVFEGPTTASPVRLVVGSPGGPRIASTVAQAVINFFDHHMTVQEAIAAGRIHHQHLPDHVSVEARALDSLTVRELERRGHALREEQTWSNATAIAIDPATGIRTGAADPRGIGAAVAE